MKEEMNSVFSEQVLAEKLLKLNNSQQSIETLSHWCIFHRKKAKNIVETWEGQFNSSSREQKVCLMYLANDILQNSKRKGNEFVNEFWKVLPPALRNILENGDENAKKVVTRLIEIWDLRKVFGSRSKALKDDIFGDSPPAPILENNAKNSNSNPVKVVRKDANTVRIKVAVGGMPEKIMTAYQTMLEKCSNEESDLNNFNSSINLLDKIEKDINDALTSGNQQQISSLLPEFDEKENSLKQSIEHLEGIETIRASLINQLKEALKEQESKSELNRAQIQAGRSKMEQAVQLKHKISSPSPTNNSDASDFKKTAAEVAARLAASSSSAQLFSSVLSSFALQSHSSPNNNPNTTFPNTTNNPNTTFPNTTNNPNTTFPNTTTGITNSNNNVESECKRQRIDNVGSFVPLVPVSVPLSVPMQFGGFGFNGGSMPPPPPLTSAPLASAPGQQGFFQSQPGIGFFPLQPTPSAQRQQ